MDERQPAPDFDIGTLTRGLARGDEGCFDRFYAAYAERLYRYLVVLRPQDEGLVQEAFQDAMLRVTRYAREFAAEEVFWCWLTRVARTALIDLLRRRQAAPGTVTPELLERLADPSAEEQHLPRLLELLREALQTLASADRALVEARYFEQRSHDDLASAGHTTVRAVESRLFRLRAQLRAFVLGRLP